MPGEPRTSSIVPGSVPGCRAERGSAPPAAGRWQVPQATVLSLDNCSSQNRILPRTRFSSVMGFSAGTGTGGSSAAAAESQQTDAAAEAASEAVAASDASRMEQVSKFMPEQNRGSAGTGQ